MTEERIESGIPGLDKLVQGGFFKGSANMIAGTTGTCKTIFGCQYILHGLRNNENGVYVTLEQRKEDILGDVAVFGWDKELKSYMEKKKFKMHSEFPSGITELGATCRDLIEEFEAERFVLDSLSLATVGWKGTTETTLLRREVFNFIQTLKDLGVTSLLITEISEGSEKLSRFGFEEFTVDSILILHYLEYAAGGLPRSLIIRKMRRTDHATDVYPLKVTKKGLKILPAKKGVVI